MKAESKSVGKKKVVRKPSVAKKKVDRKSGVSKKPIKLSYNGSTYLAIINGGLCILDDNGYIAKTSIKICNGFYIELGRLLIDVMKALDKTKVPIMFETVSKQGNLLIVKIIRVKTSKQPELCLGTFTCIDGEIVSVSCGESYTNLSKFDNFKEVGSLWSSVIPEGDTQDETLRNISEYVKNVILSRARSNTSSCDIRFIEDETIEVIYTLDSGEMYNLEYGKDSELGGYVLITISKE